MLESIHLIFNYFHHDRRKAKIFSWKYEGYIFAERGGQYTPKTYLKQTFIPFSFMKTIFLVRQSEPTRSSWDDTCATAPWNPGCGQRFFESRVRHLLAGKRTSRRWPRVDRMWTRQSPLTTELGDTMLQCIAFLHAPAHSVSHSKEGGTHQHKRPLQNQNWIAVFFASRPYTAGFRVSLGSDSAKSQARSMVS